MEAADYLGLGEEAGLLLAWTREHRPPLSLRVAENRIEDAGGAERRVSAKLSLALERLDQWFRLAAPSDHPITHEQLRAAALAPASIDRIRAIFEAAIRRGVRIGDQWLTPETGGEATIDGELRLAEAEDPRWKTVQDLAGAASDPTRVAALYRGRTEEVRRVDTHGLLKVAIARFELGQTAAAAEIRRAVATVAQNAAPTYAHDPEQQFALIASRNWAGRYVGRWHTHGPHERDGSWSGGHEPSFEDMQNAMNDGQYLTVSFQPDGFDLYDASALADEGRVDLSLLKVIRHRSSAWRDHFQRLAKR